MSSWWYVVVRRIQADAPPVAGLVVAGRSVPVVPHVVFHDARHLVGPVGTTAVFEALEGVPLLVKPRARSCCGVRHASGTRCGVPHGSDTCSGSQGVGAGGLREPRRAPGRIRVGGKAAEHNGNSRAVGIQEERAPIPSRPRCPPSPVPQGIHWGGWQPGWGTRPRAGVALGEVSCR